MIATNDHVRVLELPRLARDERIEASRLEEPLRPPPGSGDCRVRRAISRKDLTRAYSVLLRVRVALGYPRPPLSAVLSAPDDRPGETATFIAEDWPKTVGLTTVRVAAEGPALPGETAFPELTGLRRSGRLVSELTNRVVVPRYYRTGVPSDLLLCGVGHALMVGCTDVLAAVRPWEQPAMRALGFSRVGAIRSSGGPVPEPTALVRLDLERLREAAGRPAAELLRQFYISENPYLEEVARWAAQADQALRAEPAERPADAWQRRHQGLWAAHGAAAAGCVEDRELGVA